MRHLRAIKGPEAGQSFPLSRRTVIGRHADADIQLVDKLVSRFHACVAENDQGKPILVDLTSANGTFLKKERIRQTELRDGDQILIGESEFIYKDGPPAAPEQLEEQVKLASGVVLEDTVFRRDSDK